jgi:predicted patatin/cPLA2 family phospholipase
MLIPNLKRNKDYNSLNRPISNLNRKGKIILIKHEKIKAENMKLVGKKPKLREKKVFDLI